MRDVIISSERAAHLTRQVLAYAGKGQFFIQRINLSRWIQEAVALIRAAIPTTVELQFQLGEQLPAIDADPAQLLAKLFALVVLIKLEEGIEDARRYGINRLCEPIKDYDRFKISLVVGMLDGFPFAPLSLPLKYLYESSAPVGVVSVEFFWHVLLLLMSLSTYKHARQLC